MIDVGRSYQNLCEALDGQFLAFARDSAPCLNPFELIRNWEEEADVITALVTAMAAPTEPLGDTPVDRLLGKELCVLAWAIERLEPEKISIAVRNWLALRPEERWWLFGMTAMATGGLHDADKGWRVALRYALGDVAQNELLRPRSLVETTGRSSQTTLPLFED